MREIIENLPDWVKITGVSSLVTLVILLILYFAGATEAIKTPSTLNEIKENVSQKVVEETENSGVIIVKEFGEQGKNLAKDVKDPLVAKTIEQNFTVAGWLFATVIFLVVVGVVHERIIG